MVGLQNVLQGVQGKAQTALTDSALTDSVVTDSALTDSAVTDSALTDSAAVWTDTVIARHSGTVHTQLKVALLCG